MKMIAFLAGELIDSSIFFSSFAVSTENGYCINGTFGKEQHNKWKPWKYCDRIKVAKRVEELKLTDSTKRSRVTKLISSCNSRQEFLPPIGVLVEIIHIVPYI